MCANVTYTIVCICNVNYITFLSTQRCIYMLGLDCVCCFLYLRRPMLNVRMHVCVCVCVCI